MNVPFHSKFKIANSEERHSKLFHLDNYYWRPMYESMNPVTFVRIVCSCSCNLFDIEIHVCTVPCLIEE